MKRTLWTMSLLFFALSAAWSQPVDPTSPAACRVLQAAYTAAIGSKVPSYPIGVQPSQRMIELKTMAPDFRARLPLSAGEFENLLSRQPEDTAAAFQPECRWQGVPAPARDPEGHVMQVSFTHPIVSANGRLALVEISFSEQGFGYGLICIARATPKEWTAQCVPSWIT